jgi:hypothetical protein
LTHSFAARFKLRFATPFSVLAYLPLLNDALQARQILINSNFSDQVWIGLTSYHDLHTFGDWSNEIK